MAHGIHQGIVVIPKTVTYSRLLENIGATNLVLDDTDLERLRKVDIGYRLYKVNVSHGVGVRCYLFLDTFTESLFLIQLGVYPNFISSIVVY